MRRRGGRGVRELKADVFERDGGQCFYCDKPVKIVGWSWPAAPPKHDDATMDHIIPHCQGGTQRYDNVVLCCRECNEEREASSAEDFLRYKRLTGYHFS